MGPLLGDPQARFKETSLCSARLWSHHLILSLRTSHIQQAREFMGRVVGREGEQGRGREREGEGGEGGRGREREGEGGRGRGRERGGRERGRESDSAVCTIYMWTCLSVDPFPFFSVLTSVEAAENASRFADEQRKAPLTLQIALESGRCSRGCGGDYGGDGDKG